MFVCMFVCFIFSLFVCLFDKDTDDFAQLQLVVEQWRDKTEAFNRDLCRLELVRFMFVCLYVCLFYF